MTVIRFGGFRGEIPRIHPQMLPIQNAQTALNVRLDSGALESIKDVAAEQATTLTDPICERRVWTIDLCRSNCGRASSD
jgi:hypothetical protein